MPYNCTGYRVQPTGQGGNSHCRENSSAITRICPQLDAKDVCTGTRVSEGTLSGLMRDCIKKADPCNVENLISCENHLQVLPMKVFDGKSQPVIRGILSSTISPTHLPKCSLPIPASRPHPHNAVITIYQECLSTGSINCTG